MPATTRASSRVRCDSCELARINGLICHETGCPNAWQGYLRECKWCGALFRPKEKYHSCCCTSCARSYHGV